MAKILYFGYGSNLCANRLTYRTPSAKIVAPACLSGFAMRFNYLSTDGSGKCNIIKTGKESDVVWGVVWELDDSEKPLLDKCEALNQTPGYQQLDVEVKTADNKCLNTFTYWDQTNAETEPKNPYDWYHQFVLRGAEQHGLPQDYIDWLRSIPFDEDLDPQRRADNLSICDANC